MADDEAWTSGESEPEERDSDDEETYDIDFEDLENVEYVEDQIYEDSWFFPSIKDFNGTSEINQNINVAGNTPIDFFNYFFDSSLIEMIIEETNRYHFQNPGIQSDHMKPWTPFTKEDFEIFLGLSILMGHVRKGELHSYWSTDQLVQTPIFRQMMSRDRYLQILCYIHFHDNENTTLDIAGHTLAKIKPVIDFLQSKFSAALTPGKKSLY
ncbi:piggyBac transposable element-derived protein 2-like [Pseudomyrmex gracilis]|uniref:piggyBac transposable element-derived protein 2-like n=1 Tax=Pseudomyrmex gracilis TaxID=219809 RepID=UPI000995A45B|nr:piggyBac transposable element-derived protein 2-like [Pseudomyrmex gracilis]